MTSIRVAVLSDIHYFVKKESVAASSYLPLSMDGEIAPDHKANNPSDDLIKLITEDKLECDLVLCLGDITTAADPVALKTGWSYLHYIASLMDAKRVYAATGNHDVRSRSEAKAISENPVRNWSDNKGLVEQLKQLEHSYPIIDLSKTLNDDKKRQHQSGYFGECFTLIDDDPNLRVLIFNGCAEHGHDAHEFERGTVPSSALKWIENDLSSLKDTKINVCICHHPPYSQSGEGQSGYDFLYAGDQLLARLAESGHWLFLHGHKHLGCVATGPSKNNQPPIVFSAASFAAMTERSGDIDGYENQFYILTLKLDDTSLKGEIEAWQWNIGNNWTKTKPGTSRIHYGSGFGCGTSPEKLADEIKSAYLDSGITHWNELIKQLPQLKWLTPMALDGTLRKLRLQHRLTIDKCSDGWFSDISKVPI